MNFSMIKKQDIRNFSFLVILIMFSTLMGLLGATLNTFFVNLFSGFQIVIQDLRIPLLGVVIAPIDEEFVKFLGYAVIYFFGIKSIKSIGYSSKKKFRNDYLVIAFLISAGIFGFVEGVGKNDEFGFTCFIAFIILNMMIHITFSIYPFLLGRKYNNWFILFLPIGMLLHAVHNFIIGHIWDNKWVTVTMVTFLLLPIIVMERKNFYKIFERLVFEKSVRTKRVNLILSILFILLYVYIVLCVWLRFL